MHEEQMRPCDPEGQGLEERFWSGVWRCNHAWPCKRCCWPWKTVSFEQGSLYWTWKRYPVFSDPRLAPARRRQVHRLAYLFTHKTQILPGLFVCHQCDFPPCCNPAHLRLGGTADNGRDRRGKNRHKGQGWPVVILPSGEKLLYEDAYANKEEKKPAVYRFDMGPLGRRVAGRRVEKGWTQQILGDKAHLSQHTIAVIERGRHPHLTMAALMAIAEVLEVSLDCLVYGRRAGERGHGLDGM